MNSKFGDDENTMTFALQCFWHFGLLQLRLGFLGLRGKWFGWFMGGLDVISKFEDHENTVNCSIAVFCCIAVFFASQTP